VSDTLSPINFKIYRKNLLVKYLYPHWISQVWHLYKIIKEEKIELIQVGQVLPCGTAVLIINKFLKIPYIVYTHGLDILGPQKYPRKKKLIIKILSNAEKVISNSEFTKNEVEKLGIQKEKIKVVYPSVEIFEHNVEQATIDLKKKYNLSDKKILLTVCRLVERKGVDLVISALEKFGDQLKDLVYVVIGDGPKKKDLEQMSKNLPQIIFTGQVSDDELSALYKMSDIFILTPKKSEFDAEGFGIVYIEASSYGKAMIGSNIGGVVESIKNGTTGILVEPDNVNEIGNAIVKLFNNDELRNRLGRQGKERAEREFSTKKQMESFLKILDIVESISSI
jgi:phosphatidylinositol alpha-1,6-mannosyltransferase